MWLRRVGCREKSNAYKPTTPPSFVQTLAHSSIELLLVQGTSPFPPTSSSYPLLAISLRRITLPSTNLLFSPPHCSTLVAIMGDTSKSGVTPLVPPPDLSSTCTGSPPTCTGDCTCNNPASATSMPVAPPEQMAAGHHPWQAVFIALREVELRAPPKRPKSHDRTAKNTTKGKTRDRGAAGKEWGWDELHGTTFKRLDPASWQRKRQRLWDILPHLPGCPTGALPTTQLDDGTSQTTASGIDRAQVDAVQSAMSRSGPIEVYSENDAVSKWLTSYNKTYEVILQQLARHILGEDANVATHYDVTGESVGIEGATCRPDLFSEVKLELPRENGASQEGDSVDMDVDDDGDSSGAENGDSEWDESDGEENRDEDSSHDVVESSGTTISSGKPSHSNGSSSDCTTQSSCKPESSRGKAAGLPRRCHLTMTEAKAVEVLPDSIFDKLDEDYIPNDNEPHIQAIVYEKETIDKAVKDVRACTRAARRGRQPNLAKTTATSTSSRTTKKTKQKAIKFIRLDNETRSSARIAEKAAAAATATGV